MADAGRVIAGSAKGVRLDAPGPGTRPLADRVKQTLFAILEPDLDGAVVADLFAGSGAGGIEALSRGAERAVFVERHAGTARVIARNLERTGLGGQARVVTRDAIAWLDDPRRRGRGRAVRPRPRRPAVRRHRRAPRRARADRAAPRAAAGRSSPSTSGATPRRPGSGC